MQQMSKQLFCLLVTLFACAAAVQADSPNIILILTDDQGWSQRSGLMDPENPKSGSSYLHTPAMDRIADEGMRFTGGYQAVEKANLEITRVRMGSEWASMLVIEL